MASTALQVSCFSSQCLPQARHRRSVELTHELSRAFVPAFAVPVSSHHILSGRNLPQLKFLFSSPNLASARRPIVVVASTEFANKEASKFREDLMHEFEKDQSIADVKGRIADVCAKALRRSLETYTGTFSPEPFENMKAALQEQGLPTDKALRCALFWARANLHRDWKQWSALKR